MRILIKQILFLLLISGIQACSKDERQLTTDNNIILTVKAFYCTKEQPDSEKADTGSKVYVYYDVSTIDLSNSSYAGNGKFFRNNSSITPDQSYDINSEGIVNITLTYTNKKISVIVESNYYKNRLASSSFENFKKSIMCINIFHP